ncbi:hypothetical protein, variant [Aphanomyces invadans]|uniref:Uncharacterized protein n=1 Tax=Aphanomyces invadans TaxID=157072 RepID=A0A024UQA4_9STRA|nr:hypothetical protein, variant [Aphanomyces invadans]ETW08375.1 hypothetical protein, variant [Aphanomyces invadans]|eukprot:XP_008862180.1 hypothetical protein, variant [Aphanomyces invadans]
MVTQDATPDTIKPRHLSFLSIDESPANYELTHLPKPHDKSKTAHPNQDDSGDSDEGDDAGDSPLPSGSKRKRAKRAIAGDLSPVTGATVVVPPTPRIEANVVIVQQPPTTWNWRNNHPTLKFDMHLGLVASSNPCKLLPLDDRGFTLWLMNEDGNGMFGHFKLQWTADDRSGPTVAVMHAILAVDTAAPPKDDQIIRIYVSYTDSKRYNAHPMESDDIVVQGVGQLHSSALSPIPSGPVCDEPTPPSTSPSNSSMSLSYSSPLPSAPSSPDLVASFATAPPEFVMNWASDAATLLSKLQSLPVRGTLLNFCPTCGHEQSLELPMVHSRTCSLKALLAQVARTLLERQQLSTF